MFHDLPDADDEQQLAARQRMDDVRLMMDSKSGRRFVWSILVSTRFETRTTLFDTHGGRQSYLLGAYEVGRNLSDEVRRLCPENYLLMVQEHNPQTDEVSQ